MICELAVAMNVAPSQLLTEDDATIATLIDIFEEQARENTR